MSLEDFTRLYLHDEGKKRPRTPKFMDDAFGNGQSRAEQAIAAAVARWNLAEIQLLEQENFAQRRRLANAERALQFKPTKKTENERGVACRKIDRALGKLASLKRTQPEARGSRIFPGYYAPVIVSEGGQRVIKPMRFQCRLAGKPASYDQRYPGTYNARRDSLEGFWAPAFGHTHALMVVDTFYENVEGPDGTNQVVQFTPRTREPMLVAFLWSHWKDPAGQKPDLLSFAAITDDLELEVAATGHDRTIINIKPEYVDAWLNPDPANLAELCAIFDDKRHPFYELAGRIGELRAPVELRNGADCRALPTLSHTLNSSRGFPGCQLLQYRSSALWVNLGDGEAISVH